jgi:hypothetical protein
MLMHIVLLKFKKGYSWDNNEVRQAEIMSKSHVDHIKSIKGWFTGRNVTFREQAADFLVIGLFNDVNELQLFQNHHHHQQGVRLWKEMSTWQVIDIELADNDTYSKNFFPLDN